jgi:hypothetical protein
MSGPRSIIGLALVGALLACAVSASSASAKGTTAFTCVAVAANREFEDEHCAKGKVDANAGFKHEEIEVGTTTEVTATNNVTGAETSPAVIHLNIAGFELIIDSEAVQATGSCRNETVGNEKIGKEMQNHCKEVVTIFTQLKTTPESFKCEVLGGELRTNNMTVLTRETETGKGPGLNYTPEAGAGTPFIEFKLGGASCVIGKEVTIKVTGNAVGVPSGSTVTFNEKSTTGVGAEGLFIGKAPASVTGIGTVRMAGAGNPIAITKK